MNLPEMRTLVRCDLHDQDPVNQRWTDTELDRHIQHAVGDLSEAVPDQAKSIKSLTAGSFILDISDIAGLIYIETVEYPVGCFPPRHPPYSLWKNEIRLLDGELSDAVDACIYYGKNHTLDLTGSTIPERFRDIVAAGAAGYAAVQWSLFAVNRVNNGGTETPEKMLNWGKARLDLFYQQLKVHDRRNRVRVSSLFRPDR